MLFYRIEPRSSWQNALAQGVFHGELETDGFIHLSTLEQVLRVADALYAGQSDLLLLELDSLKLTSRLEFEDLYEAGELFPHLYGPLKINLVTRALELCWNGNGFVLPLELEKGRAAPRPYEV